MGGGPNKIFRTSMDPNGDFTGEHDNKPSTFAGFPTFSVKPSKSNQVLDHHSGDEQVPQHDPLGHSQPWIGADICPTGMGSRLPPAVGRGWSASHRLDHTSSVAII